MSQNTILGDNVRYTAFGALTHADYTNSLTEGFATDALGDRVSDTTYSTVNGERVDRYWPGTDRLRWVALPTASPGDTTYYCQGIYGEVGDEDAVHLFYPPDSMTVVPWVEFREKTNTYDHASWRVPSPWTRPTGALTVRAHVPTIARSTRTSSTATTPWAGASGSRCCATPRSTAPAPTAGA